MKNIGLRVKFLVLLGLILLALFSLLTYTLIQQTTFSLRGNLNEKSKAFATLATKPIADTFIVYKDSGRIRITQQAQKFYELDRDIVAVSIINTDGDVQYQYGGVKRKTIALPKGNTFDPIYTKNDKGTIIQIIQPYVEDYGGYRYSLVYTVSSARISEQINSMTYLLIALGTGLGLASMLVLYYVFNIIFIRPVREVSRLASIISAGNLDQEITVKSNDEIGDLADAVNAMSNTLKADIVQLQETDRLKNEFIMLSSHHLRTPLTVISGYVEMIQMMDVDKKLDEVIGIIDKNTQKLSKLTEDMLTISTVESGGGLISGRPVKLAPIMVKLSDDFTPMFRERKIHFSIKNDLKESECLISKSHLLSALSNTLDNALKFTPKGGTVSFAGAIKNGSAEFIINDSGVGISKEELPLLFTKFHRGTDTLEYEYDGVGLGLYLTKIIIEQFHGKVAIESSRGKGTRFTVTLPTVSSEPATSPPSK